MSKISGPALASVGIGTMLVYSGIKGKSLSAVLLSVVQGKNPKALKQTTAVIGNVAADVTPNATGTNIIPGVQAGALPSAGTYSLSQLKTIWIRNGGDPRKADVAACIASHESSGNPQVTSSNPDGGTNVGLWQLDTRGKGFGFSILALQNADNNARVAIAGSRNGTDWSAWATAPDCGV